MNQEPDFQKAIQVHKADENHKLNDYKHPSTIATLLGISEKLLARVTGSVLVNGETPTNRKINIGLMLKIRNIVGISSKYLLYLVFSKIYFLLIIQFPDYFLVSNQCFNFA